MSTGSIPGPLKSFLRWPIAAIPCLLLLAATSCTKNTGVHSNYELRVLFNQSVENVEEGEQLLDRIAAPILAEKSKDSKQAQTQNWVASKVSILTAAPASAPIQTDFEGAFSFILGVSLDPLRFMDKWENFRKEQGNAIRELIGSAGSKEGDGAVATTIKAAANGGEVLVLDASVPKQPAEMQLGDMKVEVWSDIDSLRKAIKQRLQKAADIRIQNPGAGKAKLPVITVVVRETREPKIALDLLLPMIAQAQKGLSGGLLEAFRALAEPIPECKSIGIMRDDAVSPESRLEVAGADFWTRRETTELLSRPYISKSNPEQTIEHLLGEKDKMVIGFTLPPTLPTQKEQSTERVARLYGSNQVDFYKDPEALRREVSDALQRKISVVVVVRQPPSCAMDRIIASKPEVLRTTPDSNGQEVLVGGRSAGTRWFEIMYVLERKEGPGGAFFRVTDREPTNISTASGGRTGWIPEASAVAWNGPLVVQFTHPTGRKPCLFFKKDQPLRELVQAAEDVRKQRAGEIYRGMEQSGIESALPPEVGSVEPREGLDWEKNVYVLPVLSFEKQGSVNAGVTNPGENGNRSIMIRTVSLARQPSASSTPSGQDASRDIQVDVNFVIDLSKSMGQWVDPTRAAIVALKDNLLKRFPDLAARFRFGIWGYRDGFFDVTDASGRSMRDGRAREIPGIGFLTHNFTPTLQDATQFVATMDGVKQTETDSIDLMEDMLSGVSDAITKTAWREGAGRVLILVGDAPGREQGTADEPFLAKYPHLKAGLGQQVPVGTRSGMRTSEVRALADKNKVSIASIYLDYPKYDEWKSSGVQQFRELATNPGGSPCFKTVDARNVNEYSVLMDQLAEGLGLEIQRYIAGMSPPTGTPGGTPSPTSQQDPGGGLGGQIAQSLFTPMVSEMKRGGISQILDGWIWDRDLVNPVLHPVKPCVLLSKEELSSLYETLDLHVQNLKTGNVDSSTFLLGVKNVAAWLLTQFQGTFDAKDLERAEVDIGFLRGILPYESLSLSLSSETWTGMGSHDRNRFLRGLQSKLSLYRKIQEDEEQWCPLRENQDRDEYVTLLDLEQLP